jgi:hydroxymethylpyrimidine pyrophosphatase-like HAD family hydrolase
MVVTDLDGTLFQRHHRVSDDNLYTLQQLKEKRILRVIATGRNLYSARKVLSPDFPVDFVIFSSGAGIMDWASQRLIRAIAMGFAELDRAFHLLREYRLDFMVHRPVPDNHIFVYFPSGRVNPDFRARLELYREFATPGKDGVVPMRSASQLLAIESVAGAPTDFPSQDAASLFPLLRRGLEGLNVVRTTSPLDGRSRWIEIFSAQASKAQASDWLARRCGIGVSRVLALGNDYNDLDLLEWAPFRCLVGDAPEELLEKFPQVSSGGESDFSRAVARWEEDLPAP